MKKIIITGVLTIVLISCGVYFQLSRSVATKGDSRPTVSSKDNDAGFPRKEAVSPRLGVNEQNSFKELALEAPKKAFTREFIASHPKLVAIRESNRRRVFQEGYGDLNDLLGIDAAVYSKILELTYEKVLCEDDADEVLQRRGIAVGSKEHANAINAIIGEIESEIKSALTADQYRLYQLAPNIRMNRHTLIKGVSETFRSAGESLDPALQNRIAIIMAENVFESRVLPIEEVGDRFYRKNDIKMLSQLKGILSPQQLSIVENWVNDKNGEKYYENLYKKQLEDRFGR